MSDTLDIDLSTANAITAGSIDFGDATLTADATMFDLAIDLRNTTASGGGRLILATLDGQPGGVAKLAESNPQLYGGLSTITFPAFDEAATRLPDGTADAVLMVDYTTAKAMIVGRDPASDLDPPPT